MITYSTDAQIEFDLDDLTDVASIQQALQFIPYRTGWTSTAWALHWARLVLNSSEVYGARPNSAGVPRIAILITDGMSNLFPIEPFASALRASGVQV